MKILTEKESYTTLLYKLEREIGLNIGKYLRENNLILEEANINKKDNGHYGLLTFEIKVSRKGE